MNRITPGKKYRTSHAPSCFSRFRIEITSAGVGLRQEISDGEALACGIESAIPTMEVDDNLIWFDGREIPSWAKRCDNGSQIEDAFADVWDAQHAKSGNGFYVPGWDWRFGFRLTRKDEDDG